MKTTEILLLTPTGCSTQSMAERFVQLFTFTIGLAVPVLQEKGCEHVSALHHT